MKVTFQRGDDGRYAVTALRSDNVLVRIKTHDRPKFIPHDLAHFLVERELALRGGFWGKVASGVMFDGMAVVSGRQKPRSSQRADQKDPLQEGTQAEVLVAAFVQLAEQQVDEDWNESLKFLKSLWQPPGKPPRQWHREQVEKLRSDLRQFSNTWKTMKSGEELSLEWTH